MRATGHTVKPWTAPRQPGFVESFGLIQAWTDWVAGSILLCGIAIAVSGYLLWRSERKQAAVGRRYVEAFCLSHSS